jgi:hypothetical protein
MKHKPDVQQILYLKVIAVPKKHRMKRKLDALHKLFLKLYVKKWKQRIKLSAGQESQS